MPEMTVEVQDLKPGDVIVSYASGAPCYFAGREVSMNPAVDEREVVVQTTNGYGIVFGPGQRLRVEREE